MHPQMEIFSSNFEILSVKKDQQKQKVDVRPEEFLSGYIDGKLIKLYILTTSWLLGTLYTCRILCLHFSRLFQIYRHEVQF